MYPDLLKEKISKIFIDEMNLLFEVDKLSDADRNDFIIWYMNNPFYLGIDRAREKIK